MTFSGELHNPVLPLDVGTHTLHVTMPTVTDDLFDLPVVSTLLSLIRFRTASRTVMSARRSDKESTEKVELALSGMDRYMAYECLLQVWTDAFIFRLSRYLIQFGAALTIGTTVITAALVIAAA
ncbi:MAG: hypothetical protein ACPHN2_05870 [Sinimarinibacterium flocculans]|uniref:hypothetical protein n=1 Tax=Sinimarinibacterium flocculans TaxID=985250 RepID=UPI002EB06D1B|nr:hypothetical protein [Pseudomonadota bacterium]